MQCLIYKLDNGNVYQLKNGTYIAAQWEGVSEPFETLDQAVEWVEAGCT